MSFNEFDFYISTLNSLNLVLISGAKLDDQHLGQEYMKEIQLNYCNLFSILVLIGSVYLPNDF